MVIEREKSEKKKEKCEWCGGCTQTYTQLDVNISFLPRSSYDCACEKNSLIWNLI